MDFRITLNLPDPDFTIPMKASLQTLEPQIQRHWADVDLYTTLLKKNEDSPEFVLHDGPPYTNGPIHLGTAMNKILKDFVVRSRAMMGYKTPYVPGFDNHGLPIEQSVARQFEEKGVTPNVTELRQACREHAAHYLQVQTEQFQRLGVMGMWDRPYATMEFRYEAEIIRCFGRLLANGFIYRGLRPILWSPSCQTALADSEVIYKDYVSDSVFVRFEIERDPDGTFEGLESLGALIWTTTPWTLPSNQALAFHPTSQYGVYETPAGNLLIAVELANSLAEKFGWDVKKPVRVLAGTEVESVVFRHPFMERDSRAVLANYVTMEDGTGIVHTAPGHGKEDFETGLRYSLNVVCGVDEAGHMTPESGPFAGTYYKKADAAIVEHLRESGHLVHHEKYEHSYPHAERDEKPVLFRSTLQWFVSLDNDDLSNRMLSQIPEVQWLPTQSRNRITAMIAQSPDWCISRQRPWGVGIPIFFGAESGEPVMDAEAVEAVAQMVEERGSDAWYQLDPSEILPAGYKHPKTGETEFVKETDVLDVWFDSGCSSLCVLEGNVEPQWKASWPADLYLEGSDQHRGWFNRSLVIGSAIRGEAPYKAVLTHGFVVDEKGHKMSKRYGNVVDPVQASETYGAEILRYWAASVDISQDVPCGPELLKQMGESYRRIRNTLRFLLANLYDYDPNAEFELDELDQWAIQQTQMVVSAVCNAPLEDNEGGAYARYNFTEAITSIHNFCVNELSSFYLDALKDRMYCDKPDSSRRRSAQHACHYILKSLCLALAPILPHTAEEVYSRLPGTGKLESVHLETFLLPTEEEFAEIPESDLQRRFAKLLEFRHQLGALLETWKKESGIKDSQDVLVRFHGEKELVEVLESFGDELPNLLRVSWVVLSVGTTDVRFELSPYEKCERSRIRRPDVEMVEGTGYLTTRDREALGV